MLNEELPQLLQNLIVGVERSIGRVSFNDLQMPITHMNTFNQMQPNENHNHNHHYNLVTSSPKCALKRSDLITKSKNMNQRYMLRRLTTRQDSMNSSSSGNSCDSSESSSNDELLLASKTNKKPEESPNNCSSSKSSSPDLPLFCFGNSFPHIDSDEENMEERRNSPEIDSIQAGIAPPNSIFDIPEKLFTSGIYLPGTRDLKGHPLITVDAEAVVEAGLNCYEIATLLMFYSTIPESKTTTLSSNGIVQYRPAMESIQNSTKSLAMTTTTSTNPTTTTTTTETTKTTFNRMELEADQQIFTILIGLEKSNHLCVIDYICQSLKLLQSFIPYCEILVVCLDQNLLQNLRNKPTTSPSTTSTTSTTSATTLWSCHTKKTNRMDGDVNGREAGNGVDNFAELKTDESLEDCKYSNKEQNPKQQREELIKNNYEMKFISLEEVAGNVASSQVPYGKLNGLHYHDARKWREFFTLLEPFQKQCTTAGERLVTSMNEIRIVDLQGFPTRRQLYAQHRALSRTVMDSELHNLRKYGTSMLAYLRELGKAINNNSNNNVTSNYYNNLRNQITANSSLVSGSVAGSVATTLPTSTIDISSSATLTTTTAAAATGTKTTMYSYKGNQLTSSYYGSTQNDNTIDGQVANSLNSHNGNSSSRNLQLPYKSSIKFNNDSTVALTNGRNGNQHLGQTSKGNNSLAYTYSHNRFQTYNSCLYYNNNNTNTISNTISNSNNNNNCLNITKVSNGNIRSDINAMTMNIDVAIRLEKVTLLFNEVDRAAKRLEQLTEQRRENLRELTRQRALEDEIAEVTSWITSDGNETLQRFSTIQLNNPIELKDHEQDFEKYYFISMKHLAKGRDLHAAAAKMDVLHESSEHLKVALDCFAEKLEQTRERIEGATRLHHLLNQHVHNEQEKKEIQNIAENVGLKDYVDYCLKLKTQEPLLRTKPNTLSLSNNLNCSSTLPLIKATTTTTITTTTTTTTMTTGITTAPITTTPTTTTKTTVSTSTNTMTSYGIKYTNISARTRTRTKLNGSSYRSSSGNSSFEGQTCNCWHDSRNMEDMDELIDAAEEDDDAEEEQSKIADSGLGGCDRCEGNIKLSRICSCQSLNESENLCEKRHYCDELDDECYDRPLKHFGDIHSPIEANSHLQCHSSDLNLPKMEDISCLEPKVQKTLLYIMREMIGTERDYVRSLYYVIENYIDELLRDDIPQPLRGQRNVIFGNIEKIFEFHSSHFLRELERYEYSPLKVGAAFLQMESKFYLYALYNKNKPKSDTLMSEYGTAFFKPKQLELNDKMDLASYLLKPVQRMGKYALLLQQLVKACSTIVGPAMQEISADVEELIRAEEMVKFQLRHGNDLLAMDSLRDCDVNVKEQGRLLRQNEFLVSQGRAGKKTLRQVFLFEDLVLFSKARRFPDHKNLDIYIYKNSIKTSDIGLTAHVGDSPTKFEIWFRKRKPEDTWTLQCMSEDIKNAWTEEISKLLWKQAKRNREIRLAEMSSMGIGSKPCLDIRPSNNQINDRSITITQLGKAPKLRHSFVGLSVDQTKSQRRPNSLISESSISSGTSNSSISTGSSSGIQTECQMNTTGKLSSLQSHGLELINETQTLTIPSSNFNQSHLKSNANNGHNHPDALVTNAIENLSLESPTSPMTTVTASGLIPAPATAIATPTTSHNNSHNHSHSHINTNTNSNHCNHNNPSSGVSGSNLRNHKRSTTLVSQLSMESGILSDISVTPDRDLPDSFKSWSTATTPTGAIAQQQPTAIVTLKRQKNPKSFLPNHLKSEENSNSPPPASPATEQIK